METGGFSISSDDKALPGRWRPHRRSSAMRRLRILVVEDDALQCMLLNEVLAVLGHDVCGTAATEMEAIAVALNTLPDVMLVDGNLRSGNGVSAVRAILRHTVMPHIYISGGGRMTLPANATVLQKPYEMADLKAALDSLAALLEGQGLATPLFQHDQPDRTTPS